jgi:uncharacterized protein
MQWLNQPAAWESHGNVLTMTSDARTDFWRKTHNNAIRDNGHFYYREAGGDFIAEVKITGDYRGLYDQAGLMARLDETTWIKCGIELLYDVQQASAVITRDYSDWSVVPLSQHPPTTWFRLIRQGDTIEVYYALDGSNYFLLRQGYLTLAQTLQVGLMCASPETDGFSVTFEDFAIHTT